MTCTRCQKLFSKYMDDDLSVEERRGVEDHLAKCNRCSAEFAGFREVVTLTADLPRIQPSPDFDASLRARLAKMEVPRHSKALYKRRPITVALGLVCLLLVVGIGGYFFIVEVTSQE